MFVPALAGRSPAWSLRSIHSLARTLAYMSSPVPFVLLPPPTATTYCCRSTGSHQPSLAWPSLAQSSRSIGRRSKRAGGQAGGWMMVGGGEAVGR